MATLNNLDVSNTPPTEVAESSLPESNKPLAETSPWEDYSASEEKQAPPWEEFKAPLEKSIDPKGSIKGSAIAAGKELLAATETVGSLLGFAINAVEAPIMDVAGTLSGSQTPFEDTNKALEKFNNTKVGRILNTPVSALTGIDLEDTNVMVLFGEIGKIIDKTANAATSVNGNNERGELTKQFANIAMLAGGGVVKGGLSSFHKALKANPVGVINGDIPVSILPTVKVAPVVEKPLIKQFTTDNNGTTKEAKLPTTSNLIKELEAPVTEGYIPFEKAEPNLLKPELSVDAPLNQANKNLNYQDGNSASSLGAIRETIVKTFDNLKNNFIRAPEVLKATKTLDNELAFNKNMNIRDEADINTAYKELQTKAGLTPELDRKFIDILENPNIKLSLEEQHVYDNSIPYAQEYFKDAMDAYNNIAGKHGEYDTSIFPRFAIGKGGIMDRMLESVNRGQSPILGKRQATPSATKTRTTFALEHPDGTREVITLGHNNSMTSWKDGKASLIANFDGPIKLGMELEGNGFDGAKIKQATFTEAEQHTDTKYFPNAVETLLRKGQEYKAATRVLKTIDRLKTSPDFSQLSAHEDMANVPDTWRKANVSLPGLNNWKFEPNLAETLEDYAGNRLNNGAVKTLELVQNGILKAMFLWPLPHMNNEGLHWIPSRGLEGWFSPKGLKELKENSGPAIDSVLKQDALQREITQAGGQLMYPQVFNDYYWKNRVDATLKAVKTQPTFIQMAKDLSMTPVKLVSKMSEYSNKTMWAVRDMMVTELYMAEKQKNPERSPAELMEELERHMPSYRIPNRVMGSRSVAWIMKQPLISVFSYYHYGMAKSFGEFGKSLAAPLKGEPINWRTSKQEFVNGASKAVMLGAMYAIIYPAMDKTMEMASGVPGKFRRAGGLALLGEVGEVATGKEPPQNLINALITTNPSLQVAIELKNNRDLFTGREINDHLGTYALDKLGPLRHAGAVSKGKKSAKEALLEYGLDYKSKSTADLIREASENH